MDLGLAWDLGQFVRLIRFVLLAEDRLLLCTKSLRSIASQCDVPVIADGGISNSGHIVIALVLGASIVMTGSFWLVVLRLLVLFYLNGHRLKKYLGMGSLEAITKGSDQRYLGDKSKLKIEQGVVGAVADKGSILKFVPYTMHAVKQGIKDLGASSLQSAHDLLRSEVLRLEVFKTPKEEPFTDVEQDVVRDKIATFLTDNCL